MKIKTRVADGLKEGLDIDGGRWYVVCETHGCLVTVETRAIAYDDARNARELGYCEWCDDCINSERKSA